MVPAHYRTVRPYPITTLVPLPPLFPISADLLHLQQGCWNHRNHDITTAPAPVGSILPLTISSLRPHILLPFPDNRQIPQKNPS
jgi:hypothetical protein